MVGPFSGAEVPVAPKAMLMMEKIGENDLEKRKYRSESGRQDVEMREGSGCVPEVGPSHPFLWIRITQGLRWESGGLR